MRKLLETFIFGTMLIAPISALVYVAAHAQDAQKGLMLLLAKGF